MINENLLENETENLNDTPESIDDLEDEIVEELDEDTIEEINPAEQITKTKNKIKIEKSKKETNVMNTQVKIVENLVDSKNNKMKGIVNIVNIPHFQEIIKKFTDLVKDKKIKNFVQIKFTKKGISFVSNIDGNRGYKSLLQPQNFARYDIVGEFEIIVDIKEIKQGIGNKLKKQGILEFKVNEECSAIYIEITGTRITREQEILTEAYDKIRNLGFNQMSKLVDGVNKGTIPNSIILDFGDFEDCMSSFMGETIKLTMNQNYLQFKSEKETGGLCVIRCPPKDGTKIVLDKNLIEAIANYNSGLLSSTIQFMFGQEKLKIYFDNGYPIIIYTTDIEKGIEYSFVLAPKVMNK